MKHKACLEAGAPKSFGIELPASTTEAQLLGGRRWSERAQRRARYPGAAAGTAAHRAEHVIDRIRRQGRRRAARRAAGCWSPACQGSVRDASAASACSTRSAAIRKGKNAVVIGRSPLVGKPVALLLARVTRRSPSATRARRTSARNRTRRHRRRGDRRGAIKGEWIKPVPVMSTSDQSRAEQGSGRRRRVLCRGGEARGAITPVPGGVGDDHRDAALPTPRGRPPRRLPMSRRTPLHELHRGRCFTEVLRLGRCRCGTPASSRSKHRAHGAGLLDVSHMASEIRGGRARGFASVATNDASRLQVGIGAVHGVVAPTTAARSTTRSSTGSVTRRFTCSASARATPRPAATGSSSSRSTRARRGRSSTAATSSAIALQGPRAVGSRRRRQRYAATGTLRLRRADGRGVPVIAARTGYTARTASSSSSPLDRRQSSQQALTRWRATISRWRHRTRRARHAAAGGGAAATATSCRDISPLEAGLGWAVKLDKGDFIGGRALAAQKQRNLARRLVGIELREPGIARADYPVKSGDRTIGIVTSGTKSPTLGTSIALCFARERIR